MKKSTTVLFVILITLSSLAILPHATRAQEGTYLHVKLFGLDDDDHLIDVYVDGEYWVSLEARPGVYTTSEDKPVQGGLSHEVEISWHDDDENTDFTKTQSQVVDEGENQEFVFLVNAVTEIPSLYHTYGETVLELMTVAQNYPPIVRLESIGTTYHGRDIWALKISDNPDIDGEEPAVLFVGCTHAREIITVEACLHLIDQLVQNYGTDQAITDIVNNREIWIIPMLNPDGHIMRENGEEQADGDRPPPFNLIMQEWRKNARPVSGGIGVDLNRNYGYRWGEDLDPFSCGDGSDDPSCLQYWGPSAFSELETRAIRNLVLRYNFALSLSWHSYGGYVLYPWGWTEAAPPETQLFQEIAQGMADSAGSHYIAIQASDPTHMYLTSGNSDDWLYGHRDIKAFTIEIEEIDGTGFTPPNDQGRIDEVCGNNFEAAKYLAAYDVFHINAISETTLYNKGDATQTTVAVTNFGDETRSFMLGVSFKDPLGDVEKYDPQISITPTSATLDSGEKTTFDVEWTVPSDVPSGSYEIAVNCWIDDTYTERYVDDLSWKPIFSVLPALAATPVGYDNMQSVLDAMGYSYSNIPTSTLSDLSLMEDYDVIFINCKSVYSPGSTFGPIRDFVSQGGAIYASDWAYEYVEGAFPVFAEFGGHIAPSQTTTGNIVDAGLEEYVGSETMNIVYNLGAWVPVTHVSDEATVYVTNTVYYSGQTHENIPTVIGFRYGDGYVVYTSFHHAAQDELARRLMEYLVLTPTTTDLRTELEDILEDEGYAASETYTDSFDEEETKSYSYLVEDESNLVVGANWYGSAIGVSAIQPDGTLSCTESSWIPPLVFEIPNAEPGVWTFLIEAIDIPYPNYPVVLMVGIPMDVDPPLLSIQTPSENAALQDGVTLSVLASDPGGVEWVTFSIRGPNGEYGTIIDPEFESMPATHTSDDAWELSFDTTRLPDGYYRLLVRASDAIGNEGNETVDFSIRNWACVELLPSSKRNRPGRTMPVKFSLRVVEDVDPAQPFVYNEDLTIMIYEEGHPGIILQTSTFGTTAEDYRIDQENEHYITNYQTLKTSATYIAEIYRKDMLIGSFRFDTQPYIKK